MAQQLVWKTWRCEESNLEHAMAEMQAGKWSMHSLMVTRLGVANSDARLLLVASRFEPEPEQERIGIPVAVDAYAFYQTLPSDEQQAMQVLLGGVIKRYYQQQGKIL